MNAVEIEEAISNLAENGFDPETFPFAFLEAFGNPAATIKRLKSGSTNQSDIEGGVLQRNNIHIAICEPGAVSDKLTKLKESPATKKAKAKFVVATDGVDFEAEDLTSDDPPVICSYQDFPDHFGFFLPLAGISTVKQIRESSFDIKATGRLNRLYVQLIQDNPEWGTTERRHDMNHFMARLIFCFFAEDTDIFKGDGRFTRVIEQMSARDSSNTHEIMGELFRAMDTKFEERDAANLPRWASDFPYVNGGLFSGTTDVPRFSKIARSYLIHIGNLDWTKINPDIFGSMIQAVTDEEERGALGLHYTSVPNILKVLNPLFLDDLRAKLEEAGDNSRKLLNLRNRMAKIRVFDPACGSGNFLVISYKEMRAIEAEVNKRRGEPERRTDIPLTNFRGIELRDFPAEIARLALIIAEYQCDVLYRGQKEALDEFLPLDAMNWIINGNALRLDWLSICPPTGTGVKLQADDLFETSLEQAEIDFENEGGETYICGNPPYLGSRGQDKTQKADLSVATSEHLEGFRGLDFVAGWLVKAAKYIEKVPGDFAFVATNSICQGQQVPLLWPWMLQRGLRIKFAYTSFKWSNLASHNAGVTVVIVGMTSNVGSKARLFSQDESTSGTIREVSNINPYLVPGKDIFVSSSTNPLSGNTALDRGSAPTDGGAYLFGSCEKEEVLNRYSVLNGAVLRAYGANEFSKGIIRWAIKPDLLQEDILKTNEYVSSKIEAVRKSRQESSKAATRRAASTPEKYTEDRYVDSPRIFVPQLVAEGREYVTPGLLPEHSLVLAPHFQTDTKSLVPFALVASRLHLVWVATVCGKLKTDYRYSNTLGWNTFPVPQLTEKNKEDLNHCAKEILLAREAHFPTTIAELYDPKKIMPSDLRRAHKRNDEVLERVYIGRQFKNDTERLEKLFDLYTKMTSGADSAGRKAKEEYRQ